MRDELERRIQEILDLGEGQRGLERDEEVARALASDDAAARYASELARIDAALRAWPAPARDEAGWEALAARVEASLDDALPFMDPTVAPELPDDAPPGPGSGAATAPAAVRAPRAAGPSGAAGGPLVGFALAAVALLGLATAVGVMSFGGDAEPVSVAPTAAVSEEALPALAPRAADLEEPSDAPGLGPVPPALAPPEPAEAESEEPEPEPEAASAPIGRFAAAAPALEPPPPSKAARATGGDDSALGGVGPGRAPSPPAAAAARPRPTLPAATMEAPGPERPSATEALAALRVIEPALRGCGGAGTPPSAEVALTFGPSGRPDAIAVLPVVAGSPAARCVERAIRTARVSAGAGLTLRVRVPLRPGAPGITPVRAAAGR